MVKKMTKLMINLKSVEKDGLPVDGREYVFISNDGSMFIGYLSESWDKSGYHFPSVYIVTSVGKDASYVSTYTVTPNNIIYWCDPMELFLGDLKDKGFINDKTND